MTPPTAAEQAQAARDKHPDAWIAAEAGDAITGEIMAVSFAWSDQRMSDYPLLTVKQDDGQELKVHCFSAVLYNEAMRQRPLPGERVTITYLGVGEAKVRGQNGAKRYTFRIDGRGAEAVKDMYDRAAGQAPKGTRPPTAKEPDPEPVIEGDLPF